MGKFRQFLKELSARDLIFGFVCVCVCVLGGGGGGGSVRGFTFYLTLSTHYGQIQMTNWIYFYHIKFWELDTSQSSELFT